MDEPKDKIHWPWQWKYEDERMKTFDQRSGQLRQTPNISLKLVPR